VDLKDQSVEHFWDQRGFRRPLFRRAREIEMGQAKSFLDIFFKDV